MYGLSGLRIRSSGRSKTPKKRNKNGYFNNDKGILDPVKGPCIDEIDKKKK
jgi:hypothetical protein